jgi:NADPH:quinone reductase-like Zn-dependent oxidoreductase
MRAWIRDRYGSPDVLRLDTLPDPVPTADDVLVRVRYASVNHADIDYLTATPMLTRMGTGMRRPRHARLGLDVAGEVVSVGSNALEIRPGQRVMANLTTHGMGAFGELVKAPEKAWHRIPDEVSLEDAATLPESALLALQGLRMLGGWPSAAGKRVLVNGASGCTGPFSVQLAKAAGAEVTGVARTSKLDLVLAAGADHVIDHTAEDVTRGARRWDLVIDAAGNRNMLAWVKVLAPGGRYTTFGSSSTPRILGGLALGPLLSVAARPRKLGLMIQWKPNDPADSQEVLGLVRDGTLRPMVDRTYPLEEVPDALRRMQAGEAKGKLLIAVG